MLEKNKIDELLKNKEYEKITDILRSEYITIIENFFMKNGIVFESNATLLDLLANLGMHFPEYTGISDLLTEAFFSEEMSDINRITTLVDAYSDIAIELT